MALPVPDPHSLALLLLCRRSRLVALLEWLCERRVQAQDV